MTTGSKYFVGNWKMFGIPSSFKILDRINQYFQKDTKNKRKYKIIMAPPFTLLQNFVIRYKNKNIFISAQNCYHKDSFGAYTGNISPFMLKKIGINYVIIGHSENRASGETDAMLKKKVFFALKNNLNIIFCIGENKKEKRNKKTFSVLKKQLTSVLEIKYNFKNIIIAYEPIWSIGSGKVPSSYELLKISINLKKFIKSKFKLNKMPKFLYGGSVNSQIISDFKSIKQLDGFLIGGASKSSKNFIDIIKNFYK